jgi:hypothetical protein
VTNDSVGEWLPILSQTSEDLIIGAPAASVFPSGEVHVVYHRADHKMRHVKRPPGSNVWTEVLTFDAPNDTFEPTLAASLEPGRLDLFTRRSDGQVQQRIYKNGVWNTAPSLIGTPQTAAVIVGAPAAVALGPNPLDLAVRGTDNILWKRAWTDRWCNWEQLLPSVKLASEPSITAGSTSRLDIFAADDQSRITHVVWAGEWTSCLVNNGALCDGPPAGVAHGSNRLDVFIKGLDGFLYRMSRNS